MAISGQATQAVQQATRTIPIVMSQVNDPVGSGLVASLARPGGHVTGTTVMSPDLAAKHLELLKEMVPKVSLVAFLRHPDNPASAAHLREEEAAARTLRVGLLTQEVRNPQEIDSAFAAITRKRAGALMMFPDQVFFAQRRQIAELAAKRRLPTICPLGPEPAEAGGLMVYGPNLLDLERRVASYVDNLRETLAAHGATFKHVVKENVFTTDMDALEAHNDLRIKFYVDDGSAPPASTWIGCTSLAAPGLMLEVECIAVLS